MPARERGVQCATNGVPIERGRGIQEQGSGCKVRGDSSDGVIAVIITIMVLE
jgi:hypothetical protein